MLFVDDIVLADVTRPRINVEVINFERCFRIERQECKFSKRRNKDEGAR